MNRLTKLLQSCVGKRIAHIECEPYYEKLKITFDDNTSLLIEHDYDVLDIYLNGKQLHEFYEGED